MDVAQFLARMGAMKALGIGAGSPLLKLTPACTRTLHLACSSFAAGDSGIMADAAPSISQLRPGLLTVHRWGPCRFTHRRDLIPPASVYGATRLLLHVACRVPVCLLLTPNVLNFISNDKTPRRTSLEDKKHFFVAGGFCVVKDDSTASVTAAEAVPVEDLDLGLAQAGLAEAKADLAKATNEMEKAEAQIGIDTFEVSKAHFFFVCGLVCVRVCGCVAPACVVPTLACCDDLWHPLRILMSS